MIWIIAIYYALSSSPEVSYREYCQSNLLAAKIGELVYGVPASVQFAQAIVESGAGRSYIAQNSNNHFGIKYYPTAFSGEYFIDRAGQRWRSYCSVFCGYLDHAAFIAEHYPSACRGKFDRFERLSGYGGSQYWKHIVNVVREKNLQRYDGF